MADRVAHKLEKLEEKIKDKDELKKAFDTSHFDLNAIVRGIQLTLVGANRALQNPEIFTNQHYRQAAIAVVAGIAIRLIVQIPIIALKLLIRGSSLIWDLDQTSWDDTIVNALDLLANHVLQIPLFLMTLMRYMTPTLDNMFMDSLKWVDMTYVQKHKHDNPNEIRDMYYPNLSKYKVKDGSTHTTSTAEAVSMFLYRFGRKAAISLAIFGLSYIPYVGRFVLPAASFYTFNKAVGLGPAAIIFGTGVVLPKKYLIIFLQTYFASRSLMRELLEPYFSRVHMNKAQKKNWFHSREGLLFGFGIGFYALLRVPLLGVLIYGIAEASTAYLITKITDPPPAPAQAHEYAVSQQEWTNKHEFLSLSLFDLDKLHHSNQGSKSTSTPGSATTIPADPPSYDEATSRGRKEL
ncbi:transmembrane protein UsgS [Apiospora marii]|uniref:Transmembrane protein UsgS n=1 Tax=Apiospora marii TaxID=335849 RepID=A0ABR1RN22_9PEZI